MLDEDVDFIKLYKWLWHRHENTSMTRDNFRNSIETFLIENHDLFNDDTDERIAQVLISMGLLENGKETRIQISRQVNGFITLLTYKLVYKNV